MGEAELHEEGAGNDLVLLFDRDTDSAEAGFLSFKVRLGLLRGGFHQAVGMALAAVVGVHGKVEDLGDALSGVGAGEPAGLGDRLLSDRELEGLEEGVVGSGATREWISFDGPAGATSSVDIAWGGDATTAAEGVSDIGALSA